MTVQLQLVIFVLPAPVDNYSAINALLLFLARRITEYPRGPPFDPSLHITTPFCHNVYAIPYQQIIIIYGDSS